ncbi:hypothetical protein TrRE_jg5701, partial [Triparma retinervis]
MTARAVQIVSIGSSEDDYSFTLDDEALMSVLSKAPPEMKISVVSCVGAFRTGKSALLSWFLRYLRLTSLNDDDWEAVSTPGKEGEEEEGGGENEWWNKGGKLNEGEKFDWRGGQERHTTGIWMCIYNVSGRIGEDALQHLALFSEYGRVALRAEDEEGAGGGEDEDGDDSRKKRSPTQSTARPFQKIEFLVRDWQNFTIEDPSTSSDFAQMESEMDAYLKSVIKSRDAEDLAETRQQISECFEKVSAYLLTHPGIPVTRKNFDGDPAKVDPTFLKLLDRYVKRVFSTELEPKTIHGRTLTSSELGAYIKAYASIFKGGEEFPEPTTLLKATASANNANAKMVAAGKYKAEMDHAFGPRSTVFAKTEE